ncbi:hypothetical protein GS597_00570 [Synechococcales cyanobacterium C]|uniref:Uncharacterized protein n=1 Tax=Petrachloros mirabilis ULC683 TaxID=2781853 RepID=A0A8K2A678_9CYAN|nr:hypothetical protein [Petrachloros mirabilis]NCJ05035.1 hypothetical protein [Petrachloros mirabilis ULC683]
MSSLPDLFQKAFYLGVGLASYTGEQVNRQMSELRSQAQTLADDMIRRGEMTTEQANQWLETVLQQTQTSPSPPSKTPDRPQVIEIETLDD